MNTAAHDKSIALINCISRITRLIYHAFKIYAPCPHSTSEMSTLKYLLEFDSMVHSDEMKPQKYYTGFKTKLRLGICQVLFSPSTFHSLPSSGSVTHVPSDTTPSPLSARCSVLDVPCSVFGARCSVFGARCSVVGTHPVCIGRWRR